MSLSIEEMFLVGGMDLIYLSDLPVPSVVQSIQCWLSEYLSSDILN